MKYIKFSKLDQCYIIAKHMNYMMPYGIPFNEFTVYNYELETNFSNLYRHYYLACNDENFIRTLTKEELDRII